MLRSSDALLLACRKPPPLYFEFRFGGRWMMPRQDTTLESAGAEFLVLGQLLVRGIPANKMYGNQRGYDLVATWPDSGRFARIQVKSRWATDASFFLIRNVDECDLVVLVRLNRGRRYSAASKTSPQQPGEPEYYILTADSARSLIVDQESGWGKIRWQKSKFEEHRQKWNRITKFLQSESEDES
jgi:hypothetical protein